MKTLRSLQVHLDFHTSELMPDVGGLFDEKQFQRALKLGHVNSITVFAKCHHSWSYYPTKVGMPHPTLRTDLLGRQIRACHEIGVRCPIYITVGWSANDAEMHPEWCARKKDGSIATINFDLSAKPETAKPIVSWKYLCPGGGYRDLILAQTREICGAYPADGFFYDICFNPAVCYCDRCRAGMASAGVDMENEDAVRNHTRNKWVELMRICSEIIKSSHPEASIFFNGGANMETPQEVLDNQTHFEMEDLPTTWGGYDKFPLRARNLRRHGKPYLAMSGKFHTMWGEFGGFKHPDAIRYEAAAMVAYGASCSFGDQMHPCGRMDLDTYRNIGAGYSYVRKIESYGIGALPLTNLALIPGTGPGLTADAMAHAEGVASMLLETQHDFDVVEPGDDLSKFQTVILPGSRFLSAEFAARLNRYVRHGGSLLVLGESALEAGKDSLLFDVGGEYLGPAMYKEDYLAVGPLLGKGLVSSPFLNYTAAIRVRPTDGRVLAAIHEPYFDRTYGHYCSHQNTPNRLEPAEHAGALGKGRIIFLPHPLGKMYHEHGARVHRDLFINALDRLHTKPFLHTCLPSSGRATMISQPRQRRHVVHLLYAPPLKRGRCLVIEDIPVLRDVPVSIRVPEKIKRAFLPLTREELSFKMRKGVLEAVVPEMRMHQMLALEWE
ncbi:MAG: alpha-amylase family protein [Victivallales bacterium]